MAREKTVRLLLTHLVVRRRHHVAPTASGLARHSEHVLCRYIRHRVQDCARRPQRRARGRSRFSAAEHAERGQPRVRQGAPRCRPPSAIARLRPVSRPTLRSLNCFAQSRQRNRRWPWAVRSGRSLTAADRHSGQHISLQQSAQGQRDPNPVREIAYVRIIKIAARNGDVRRWIVP
jgi:hypothetical protein